jgi:hypothetical protein
LLLPAACVGMAALLPLVHRLDTNPNYIIVFACATSLTATLVKAFTTQVLEMLWAGGGECVGSECGCATYMVQAAAMSSTEY